MRMIGNWSVFLRGGDRRAAVVMPRDRPDLLADAGLSDDLLAQMRRPERVDVGQEAGPFRAVQWMPFHATGG